MEAKHVPHERSGTFPSATEPPNASELRLRVLEESGPDLISESDRSGLFLFASPNHSEVLGKSPEQLVGRSVFEIIHEEDQASVMASFRDCEQAGEPARVTCRLHHGDGSWRWFEITARTYDAGSGQSRVLFVGRDVHEHRDTAEALRQSQKRSAEAARRELSHRVQQERKQESLGVLARGIAHDFNNLLAGIQGNAHLALMDLSPSFPAFAMLKDIEMASERAALVTQDLLAYAGKTQLSARTVNLSALIEGMAPMLRSSMPPEAKLELTLDDPTSWTKADTTQIRQVVVNLISNGFEALEGRPGTVRLTTGVFKASNDYLSDCMTFDDLRAGEYTYIEVRDTGSGMNEETLMRIFDPFFTTKFQGRGLGLATTLGIVRSHGGAIRVRSDEGRGTMIRLLFPITREEAGRSTPPRRGAHRGGTILVVDDEVIVLNVARRMLERIGFAVLTAGSGESAVEILRERSTKIDAVLLDATMPNMDGEATFHALRGVRRDVPVIFFTGHSEVDIVQLLEGKSATSLLRKPFTLSALHSKVDEVLNG